jgi:dihydrofolate synthase / folylpolyglutamate synthase
MLPTHNLFGGVLPMPLTYPEALDWLYSLINYEIQRPERYTPDVVSLDRPRALMALLGDPQERYPILHLTGTKGKGSVSAMCASALAAAGLRVGLYSSPHLQDFRERFQVNGALISEDVLANLVEILRPAADQTPGLTWFEVVTALAFLYFAEANVDVAVIEVGLGGRLDATNILTAPQSTTITSLSYDHMHLLGNTIEEIAFEKAGIIKPNTPVISAPQPEAALAVIRKTAAERGAPLTVVGEDFLFTPGAGDEFGKSFSAGPKDGPQKNYWTPLLGTHQAINGAVALATLSNLRSLKLSPAAMVQGLGKVNWAGRMEVVRRQPHVILDAAHNGASAIHLRNSLQELFLSKGHGGKLILIFGAFKDKDLKSMFEALLPITAHLILMHPMNPRAFSTDELAEKARAYGFQGTIDSHPAAISALLHAEDLASAQDVICITGSLSVVGEMRSVLALTPAHAAYLDSPAVRQIQAQLGSQTR